eukprot:UN03260
MMYLYMVLNGKRIEIQMIKQIKSFMSINKQCKVHGNIQLQVKVVMKVGK